MTNSQPIVEDLPVGPRAQELIHQVAHTSYASGLRKLGGTSLFREFRTGQISIDEYDIVKGEIDARKKLLTTPAGRTALAQAAQVSEAPELPFEAPPREYDARERAAGEHLDRED